MENKKSTQLNIELIDTLEELRTFIRFSADLDKVIEKYDRTNNVVMYYYACGIKKEVERVIKDLRAKIDDLEYQIAYA